MTNLIFLGISPTTKVGQNMTAKADVALLQKEQFVSNGETRIRFNFIVATAWSGMIDRFKGCEIGMVIPSVELKGDSRIHNGKVYSNHTIVNVDNKWLTPTLSPDTQKEVDRLVAEFRTTFDGTAKTYSAPTNTKASAPPVDDLPF